ncbi:MAG: hypothetical protein Q8R10_12325 [Pseudomonas sp.]|uniref:hypothetical protein n=1 Tax=Pseudomonas sp. TaxID=306 RepID=UPI00273734B5|nr:hypothetical protein [Pseudomonas sp.]MDP3847197.1 hypothetical protein [Pseudomonas sp.]
MPELLAGFTRRLHGEWLPSFCDAPHRNYTSAGFRDESIHKLTEFDAHWFMQAVDARLVSQSDGFFLAPRSKAKEQIFWQGAKAQSPRPITLWLEPVITIGALARLSQQFGWPAANLGAQSKTWEFDLVCYGASSDVELICCEVKKHSKEIAQLLHYMHLHCALAPHAEEPSDPKERNAYRKVQGIRVSWPRYFWALGPGGEGQVFRVQREQETQKFSLIPIAEDSLMYAEA